MPVPDRWRDGQTEEHCGNSVMIHSMNTSRAKTVTNTNTNNYINVRSKADK